MKPPTQVRFLIASLVFVGILVVACSTSNTPVESMPAKPLASVTPTRPPVSTTTPTRFMVVNTATPTFSPQHLPTATASGAVPDASTRTHFDRITSPGSDRIPGTLNNPRFVPRAGDIVAKTIEEGHLTGFVRISFDGIRNPIDQDTYFKHHDQTMSVDGKIRLVVRNNSTVLAYLTSEAAPPGTVAVAEGKKKIEGPAIVDRLGWYGAVIQNRRDVLLFESYNSHHQGTSYVVPSFVESLDHIAWNTREYQGTLEQWYVPNSQHVGNQEYHAHYVNELILSVRTIDHRLQIYRLSPITVWPLPPVIARDCGVRTHFLNDCMIKFYRQMPKELSLISDHGDYDASVVHKE